MEDGGATRAKVKAKAKASVLRGKTQTPLTQPRLPIAKGEKGKENNITLDHVNPSLPAPAVIAASWATWHATATNDNRVHLRRC